MKKTELKFFRKLLEERKEQIKKNINDSVNEVAELRSDNAADEFDVASMNTDSTCPKKNRKRHLRNLRNVRR